MSAVDSDVVTRQKNAQRVARVTIHGALVNVGLAGLQLTAGVLANSKVLIADSLHSFSDLVSDFVVLWTNKLASAPADEDHPYGHGKFEPLGVLVMSALLLMAGAGFAFHAAHHLERVEAPKSWAVVIAIIGLLAKEGLYHYTRWAAEEVKSELLMANAWHHRSDALSSIASLAGIVGALVGYPILDSAAAIVVGAMIIKMALSLGWSSLNQLLDSSLEFEMLTAMRREAEAIEGVQSIHALRARRMGPYVLVDMHLEVPGEMTVRAAHVISERVEVRLRESFSQVSEVLIHLDPV